MSVWKSRYYALLVASMPVMAIFSGCKEEKTQSVAAAAAPEVLVAAVVSREVTDFGEFTGRTDSVETVDMRSRVTGYLIETKFSDGQEVKKGEILFQIDPRPFKADLENAKGQKAQWEAKSARADADVKRYENLVPTGAASAQDLDKAKADRNEAVAAINSSEATIDRARLNLEFSSVTAPLDGQIGRALINNGNLIRADSDVLTTIVSLDPMYVYFDVDERAMLRLRERASASGDPDALKRDIKDLKIPVYVGLASEQAYPHQGVINFADNKVDPATGTIRARGTFDNSKRTFKPGLFARVRIPVSNPSQSLLVSDRAIGTDQGQKYVYVVDDKNTVVYRAVRMGRLQDDGLRVITEGLEPGEWVIVNGIQRARPGKPVTPQRGEMPRHGIAQSKMPIINTTQAADSKGQH